LDNPIQYHTQWGLSNQIPEEIKQNHLLEKKSDKYQADERSHISQIDKNDNS